jgi:PPOX class probable F420-dependent enzyme
MTTPTQTPGLLAVLGGRQYIRLTTFRKTGVPVSTPVWFAVEGGKIYMFTLAGAGKLKRLRHTSSVKVAPCDYRGNLLGPEFDASAHILPETQEKAADLALGRKYGWQLAALKLMYRLQGAKRVFVEIQPGEA